MASTDPGPGGQSGDVFVPATVGGFGTAFPVVRASDILGGHKTVDTLIARDAIPSTHRDEGMSVWITGTAQLFRLIGGIGNGDWVLDTGGAGTERKVEQFTAVLSQTVFVLTLVPSNLTTVVFSVEGVDYYSPAAFLTVGTTVTWNDTEFTFSGGERVAIRYTA